MKNSWRSSDTEIALLLLGVGRQAFFSRHRKKVNTLVLFLIQACQWTSSAHQNGMVLDKIILELALIGVQQELSRISKCSFYDLFLGMITYKLIGDGHIIQV